MKYLPTFLCAVTLSFSSLQAAESYDVQVRHAIEISGFFFPIKSDVIKCVLEHGQKMRPLWVSPVSDKCFVTFATREEANQLVEQGFSFRSIKFQTVHGELPPKETRVLSISGLPEELLHAQEIINTALNVNHDLIVTEFKVLESSNLLVTVTADINHDIFDAVISNLLSDGIMLKARCYKVSQI